LIGAFKLPLRAASTRRFSSIVASGAKSREPPRRAGWGYSVIVKIDRRRNGRYCLRNYRIASIRVAIAD
jgi:hypothetical protein